MVVALKERAPRLTKLYSPPGACREKRTSLAPPPGDRAAPCEWRRFEAGSPPWRRIADRPRPPTSNAGAEWVTAGPAPPSGLDRSVEVVGASWTPAGEDGATGAKGAWATKLQAPPADARRTAARVSPSGSGEGRKRSVPVEGGRHTGGCRCRPSHILRRGSSGSRDVEGGGSRRRLRTASPKESVGRKSRRS